MGFVSSRQDWPPDENFWLFVEAKYGFKVPEFQIQCSERRVFLRLAISFQLVSKFFMTYC